MSCHGVLLMGWERRRRIPIWRWTRSIRRVAIVRGCGGHRMLVRMPGHVSGLVVRASWLFKARPMPMALFSWIGRSAKLRLASLVLHLTSILGLLHRVWPSSVTPRHGPFAALPLTHLKLLALPFLSFPFTHEPLLLVVGHSNWWTLGIVFFNRSSFLPMSIHVVWRWSTHFHGTWRRRIWEGLGLTAGPRRHTGPSHTCLLPCLFCSS